MIRDGKKRYFRTLFPHIIFARHFRTLFSHAISARYFRIVCLVLRALGKLVYTLCQKPPTLSRRIIWSISCPFRTLFPHATCARCFRTLFSHVIFRRYFHTVFSHTISDAILTRYFQTLFPHAVFRTLDSRTLLSQAVFALHFRTLFSHAIVERYFRSFLQMQYKPNITNICCELHSKTKLQQNARTYRPCQTPENGPPWDAKILLRAGRGPPKTGPTLTSK